MVQRLTYRKRHSYATKSNQTRVVKTPGGKLVYQYTKKRASGPKCPVTGKKIQGIPHLRPTEYKRSRLSRNRRTVNRPYGGVLSGTAVRERIIRAFLVEEQKIVKKVLKIQKTKDNVAGISFRTNRSSFSSNGSRSRRSPSSNLDLQPCLISPPLMPSPCLLRSFTACTPAHLRSLSAFAAAFAMRAPHLLGGMPRPPDRLARLPAELASFARARAAGHASSQFSYGNALAACAPAGLVALAEQVYCAAWKDGLSGSAYVCTGMVDLLAKSGCFWDALKAFADGDRSSAVCCNAVISGAVRNGEDGLAVELFRDMVWGLCEPNSFTYSGALSACAAGAELGAGRAVHGLVLRRDPDYDVFIGTSLVNMYAKCGAMGAAMREFLRMPVRNVVSWTTAIAGFVQGDDPVSAMLLLKEMVRNGVAINKYTATSILLACSQISMIQEASQMHGMIMKTELYLDCVVKEALISTYTSFGFVELSEKVFEEVGTVRNISIWSAFISGVSNHSLLRTVELLRRMFCQGLRPNDTCYASMFSSVNLIEFGRQLHSLAIKDGFIHGILVSSALCTMYSRCDNVQDSFKVFEEMQERDGVSWISMVASFATHGHSVEAFLTFRNMILDGFKPDHVSLTAILSACILSDLSVSSSLVKVYSRRGNMDDSRKVFDEISAPDLVAWTAVIDGYALHGSSQNALAMFDLMIQLGMRPDAVVLVSVLSACSRNGLVEQGFNYFNSMRTTYGIEPELHHYCCMIDLLSRCGRLEEAKEFVDSMPIKPELMVWSTLLAACRVHEDTVLGRFVENKIRENNYDSGSFATLSNILANSGDWEEVARIRKTMKAGDKEPGWSMV
ncbi:hypothetical protein GUJ93_ZPchr0002g26765 [Zizania palustris]|uniref:60S ribosomal protein L34 n=1 Tax=Zizania palustris TaxID=103762 RepID=A0A8J5VUS3_ZIZPA|nr:hypothetical protein GUJ93_ZPchr0002g26765 [Zizania palustris]